MTDLEALIPELDRAFDALEQGDLDGFARMLQELVHADCEFRSGIGTVVGGSVYRGPQGVGSWFSDLVATTGERHWRNRHYEFFGDDISVFLADFSVTGAASGVPVSAETGAVFEWNDGVCVRITSFTSHSEAREFAGARVA